MHILAIEITGFDYIWSSLLESPRERPIDKTSNLAKLDLSGPSDEGVDLFLWIDRLVVERLLIL